VEHEERQDEREAELRRDADQLEQQGDELEQKGEQLDQQIDETREEFERKQQSSEVPGAQKETWDDMGAPPGDAAGGAPRTDDTPEEDE
jgi:hypothetical protein